jgi:hypothetical protein
MVFGILGMFGFKVHVADVAFIRPFNCMRPSRKAFGMSPN